MSCKPVVIRDDVLNDLATRFLINIPDEDKDDPLKLCSHIEVAHWFYLDLIRPEDPTLPGCSMKEFMATIFKHCPFLVRDSVARDLDTLQSQWKTHKYRRPTRGAIILNQDLTKCLLVQGYPASTSWGFPKGKLERGESDQDCAIREVYEETGFDIRALIQGEHYLECPSRDSERPSRMYIVPGVPESTEFKPRVRKEIRDIQWFRVEDLPRHKKDLTTRQNLGKNPSSFFMIIPFISQLKRWISEYQREQNSRSGRRTGGGGRKASRAVSAAFPASSTPLQPQRASTSPSPSSHLQRRATGGSNSGQQRPPLLPQPHTVQQSLPTRAVSGPGVRAMANPALGQFAADGPVTGWSPQGSKVMRSHTVPHPAQIPFQGHRQPLLTHHPHPHPPFHPLAALWHTPPHKHHSSPSPYIHSSAAQHHHYLPHPTSAFNPVTTTPATHPPNPRSKGAPATNFNPFVALGVSTTAVPGSSKVTSGTVSSLYQRNGNVTGFRPVQVKLQPAQSWIGFKFDKPYILSAMWSNI